MKTFLDGRIEVHAGDCLEVIKGIEDASIESCVCDPPYALVSIQKRFGKPGSAPAKYGKDGAYARASSGFMSKTWDVGDTAFAVEFWEQVYRVLKPGGHVLAFGGTRTYHRLACAIEDAGFEVRDQIGWAFGSGFPKSHDVSKGIDKAARGVPHGGSDPTSPNHGKFKGGCSEDNANGQGFGAGPAQFMREAGVSEDRILVPEAIRWSGWGTALKPAWEPIAMARKPIEGTVAANVLKHGTGAINVDGCRVGISEDDRNEMTRRSGSSSTAIWGGSKHEGWEPKQGRWPANLIHDGSDEVVGAFPESNGQQGDVRGTEPPRQNAVYGEDLAQRRPAAVRGDSGSAARFFYSAKADADDRLGSKHPTVKPVDLMQYLVRLVTPKGGLVLDPFAGTGTTAEAAIREGMRAVLIEREPEYLADIERRCSLILAGPDARRNATIKAKGKTADPGPLFANDNGLFGETAA